MSKLQDALTKLQRNRQAQVPLHADAELRLASSVAAKEPQEDGRDGVRRREYRYGGTELGVDLQRCREAGLLAPENRERRVADEYRRIKRPLLRNASGRGERPVEHGNLIMVASALSGEGKTFTCMNLCLSLATEKDWSVVLVDADVAKPQISRLFGLEHAPGLLDLLRDHTLEFDSLVSPTDVPGLSIMPAGARDELAAELLASARMEAVCRSAAAADDHRLIVFDSSPLLQTTEAPVLSSHVGQVVMVVQADRTSQQQVLAALAIIDSRITTSLILNQAKGSSEDAYGGYYGHGYGQDADAGSSGAARHD